MASGLLALLDDVAAIVKVTAASLDDVAAQAVKASTKAAGVVIDDAAVTPKYVVGLSPARELPIVWNIAKGSLRNKLFILLPAIMALGVLAPWALGPLLAIGGLFLCFEGYEKLHHAIHSLLHPSKTPVDELPQMNPEELEKVRTSSAIRTDFILSAEIMAISYYEVKSELWWMQILTLIVVAFLITVGVYGFVGLILKADDFGLKLARQENRPSVKWFGRLLITGMPKFLVVLAGVGTAAMLWVGGGIIIHNSFHVLHDLVLGAVERVPDQAVIRWLTEALISLVFAIFVGFLVVMIINGIKMLTAKKDVESVAKNH
jgi:predicted DNA repair protein MutK